MLLTSILSYNISIWYHENCPQTQEHETDKKQKSLHLSANKINKGKNNLERKIGHRNCSEIHLVESFS